MDFKFIIISIDFKFFPYFPFLHFFFLLFLTIKKIKRYLRNEEFSGAFAMAGNNFNDNDYNDNNNDNCIHTSALSNLLRIKNLLHFFIYSFIIIIIFYVVPLALDRKIKDIFNDISQDYYNNNK